MNTLIKAAMLGIGLVTIPISYSEAQLLTLSPESEIATSQQKNASEPLDSTSSFSDITSSPVRSPTNSLSNVSEKIEKAESIPLQASSSSAEAEQVVIADQGMPLTNHNSFSQMSTRFLGDEYELSKDLSPIAMQAKTILIFPTD